MWQVIFLLGFISSSACAQDFSVDAMPAGSEVTIPGTAGTLVPIATRIMLSSTDSPQTVSLVPFGANAVPIEVAIFDRHQDRVKYVKIAPGIPFLYSFAKLSSIYVTPNLPKGSKPASASVRLRIASDKPLSIAR